VPLVTRAEFNEWKADFDANIRSDPTSQKTWQEIERAGIACWAGFLLFWYAKGHFAVEEFADRNWRTVEEVRTARRAMRNAQSKKGDPREAIFVKRAQDKSSLTANAPWINPYHSPYQTLADAAAAMGNPPLDQLPSVMAKRGEAVRRSDTVTLLRTLQLYADKHGVRLGLRRLVALAGCANAERSRLDEKNLSRILNRPDVKGTALQLLADFEHYLP